MGVDENDSMPLGSGPRARFRVRFLASCLGRIGLWLKSGPRFNVRANARLRFRVMVNCR